MGYYINPQEMTKEEFLQKYGCEVPKEEFGAFDWQNKDYIPVVLVDNGPFTAAGICYCPMEMEASTSPSDRRFKRFYIVPRAVLNESAGLDPKVVQSW